MVAIAVTVRLYRPHFHFRERSVPLNAAIVVEVYRTSKKDQSDIPRTMTQLYGCLVRSLLRRYLKDHPVHGKQEWRIRTFDDLPPDVYKQLCELGRIAYEGIENGQQLIYDNLLEDFDTLGLMQCVPEMYVDEGAAVSHSFLHLTIHEFMAAFHLSQLPVKRQAEQFNSKAPNQRMVLRFLAGLTELASIAFGSSEMDNVELRLDRVHQMFESQRSSDVVKTSAVTVIQQLSTVTVFDCYVLGYCISHSNCSWEIDLMHCNIGDDGVNGLVQGTLEYPAQFQGAISELNLRYNSITSEGLKHLLKLPKHMLISSLKILDLECNPIGSGGCTPVIRTLSALEYINLNSTGVGVEDCRALSELLSSFSSIEILNISDNDLPPEAVELIISGLQQNTGLKELWIDGAQFLLEHCIALALALRTNCTLHTLAISYCCIGAEGAGHLAGALCENSKLQKLSMYNNPIGAAGATTLAETLTLNKSLRVLNLNHGSIGAEGTQKLVESLAKNTVMEELSLPKEYEYVISSKAYNVVRDLGRIRWVAFNIADLIT